MVAVPPLAHVLAGTYMMTNMPPGQRSWYGYGYGMMVMIAVRVEIYLFRVLPPYSHSGGWEGTLMGPRFVMALSERERLAGDPLYTVELRGYGSGSSAFDGRWW
jgi:hypothetical protein